MNITLEQLQKLCKQYDILYKEHPESSYEGYAVFLHICEQLGLGTPEDWSQELTDLEYKNWLRLKNLEF